MKFFIIVVFYMGMQMIHGFQISTLTLKTSTMRRSSWEMSYERCFIIKPSAVQYVISISKQTDPSLSYKLIFFYLASLFPRSTQRRLLFCFLFDLHHIIVVSNERSEVKLYLVVIDNSTVCCEPKHAIISAILIFF